MVGGALLKITLTKAGGAHFRASKVGGSSMLQNHKFKHAVVWLFLSENAVNCALNVLNFHRPLRKHVPHTPYTRRHIIDDWTEL